MKERQLMFRALAAAGAASLALTSPAAAELAEYQAAVNGEASLLGFYSFDGGNANDSVGANHGTVFGSVNFLDTGGAFSGGRFADFPDATGFIGLGNVSEYAFPDGTGTVSAWVLLDTPKRGGSGNLALFANRANGGATDTRYSIHFDDGGMFTWNGTTAPRVDAGIGDNDWHHVAVAFDNGAAGAEQRFYFDGQEIFVHADPLSGRLDAESTIGSAFSAGGAGNTAENWEGGIDELAIFDDALSAGVILAHFEAGVIPEPAAIGLSLSFLAFGWIVWSRRKR